jgi:16S rRNA processing protein RimM
MGRVIGAYGVRGWIRVRPFTETPETLVDFRRWWLTGPGGEASRRVIDARMHGGVPIAHLEGVDTREQAAALIGTDVAIPRDELPEIAEDEVYWSDLAGCEVFNRAGERLGAVAEVQGMAAHPVLRVIDEGPAGGGGEGAQRTMVEHLIPCVPAYLLSVDLEANRIDVDWESDY